MAVLEPPFVDPPGQHLQVQFGESSVEVFVDEEDVSVSGGCEECLEASQ